jgi:transketolase
MRNSFIDELCKLARQKKNIVLMVGDLGYSVVEPFMNEFPDRFINAGIAEQNMAGVAAGMASEGYHIFMYSIANFPTFRCAEQIRNDIAYHNLPVTIVSVGGGLAYGALGYSHHAVQDYALMRCMPNMLIAAPGDPLEVRECMRYLVNNPGPSYLRLGKAGEPTFQANNTTYSPGKWNRILHKSSDKAILTTGAGLQLAMESWINQDEYRDASVFTMPLWSMNAKNFQNEYLINFKELTTIEDHLLDGGFGSWLLEAKSMTPSLSCDIKPVALNQIVCGTVGTQETLNKLGGIK